MLKDFISMAQNAIRVQIICRHQLEASILQIALVIPVMPAQMEFHARHAGWESTSRILVLLRVTCVKKASIWTNLRELHA